jgi:hypothetical protein
MDGSMGRGRRRRVLFFFLFFLFFLLPPDGQSRRRRRRRRRPSQQAEILHRHGPFWTLYSVPAPPFRIRDFRGSRQFQHLHQQPPYLFPSAAAAASLPRRPRINSRAILYPLQSPPQPRLEQSPSRLNNTSNATPRKQLLSLPHLDPQLFESTPRPRQLTSPNLALTRRRNTLKKKTTT